MFLRGLEGWHIVIIVALLVLLFGSRKLPGAARSVGQSLRIFKSEMKAASTEGKSASDAEPPQSLPMTPIEAQPLAQPTALPLAQPAAQPTVEPAREGAAASGSAVRQ
jgi:sec-independent protein translocase protein TatA